MPYTHYGEIGDVWKHLPLAEILASERPRAYWESHAASGLYALDPRPNQTYGAIHYLDRAAASSNLRDSPYTAVLEEYRDTDGVLGQYPGSPVIAMKLLEDIHARLPYHPRYIFCDIERDAIQSVRAQARTHRIPDSRIEAVNGDGISALFDDLADASPEDLARTVAHIDPYAPMDVGDDGRSGWELVEALLDDGVTVTMWYGYQTPAEDAEKTAFFEENIGSSTFDSDRFSLWIGEMVVDAYTDPDTEVPHPGVFGSGVLCGNVTGETVDRCRAVGVALEDIYEDAVLPDGTDGSLTFHERHY